MKNLIKLFAISVVSAVSAFAATPYLGFKAGYLVDAEDALISGRAGAELFKTGSLTHMVDIEFFTGKVEEPGYDYKLKGWVGNYRVAMDLTPEIYVSGGVGLGSTRVGITPQFQGSVSSNAFTYQAEAAVGYRFTKTFSVEASVRYLDIGKAQDYGLNAGRSDVLDDAFVALGIRYHF